MPDALKRIEKKYGQGHYHSGKAVLEGRKCHCQDVVVKLARALDKIARMGTACRREIAERTLGEVAGE